jgi:hypothetical protein
MARYGGLPKILSQQNDPPAGSFEQLQTGSRIPSLLKAMSAFAMGR